MRKTTQAARKTMLPVKVHISLFFKLDAMKKMAHIIKSTQTKI